MSKNIKKAVVLAAGKGTRMKSELPKVLFPVCGKPMLEYVLDALEDAGVDEIVVVVGYRSDLVKETIKPRASYGSDYTQPIWSANNTVTMAHTWLDTNEVNGATAGYNGRAEVLGFETATDFTTHRGLFFGYYNPNNSNKNYEHIGETLIYSTTLTDAERLTVQEYLMAKWTGDMIEGDGDGRGQRVQRESPQPADVRFGFHGRAFGRLEHDVHSR